MNAAFLTKLLGQLTLFVVSVTVLWLCYTAITHAKETQWSFKEWIDDLASVNFRMVIALGLFTLTIVVLLAGTVINAGGVFRAQFDEDIVRLILMAEFGAMGWDVLAYIGKRATFKPGAPDDRNAVADESAEPPPPANPLLNARPQAQQTAVQPDA